MKDVVVGLDGSAASDKALDRALLEARVRGCAVRALRAWTTPVWVGGVPGLGYNVLASHDDSQRFAAEALDAQLGRAAQRWSPEELAPLQPAAVEGSARAVLLEASQDASLLVLAGRNEGALASALLGSTSTYAVHHASCPVLLVPHDGPAPLTVRRVVVGDDGSDRAHRAMEWALEAAQLHRCPLSVLHAWSPPPRRRALPVQESEERDWLDVEVRQVLPDGRGVPLRAELVLGPPASALLEHAGPDDLLVLGSRGTGGFRSLALGSVAAQCAQHARGAVVVVRDDQGPPWS